MNQEQPSKHVSDTIRELNAQEAATHPQTSSPNAHSNVVASQKEPVGVQVLIIFFGKASRLSLKRSGIIYQLCQYFCFQNYYKNPNLLFKGIKEIESSPLGSRTEQRGEITIGEALEATALTAGHRPVDYSDAAAIQAAEVRATGRTNIVPGGVAAAAQSAATRNARLPNDEEKTKLGEILLVPPLSLSSNQIILLQ